MLFGKKGKEEKRNQAALACGAQQYAKGHSSTDAVFQKGWKSDNNGYARSGAEVERLISVVPSPRQLAYHEIEFMVFTHFGMNTSMNREWGTGTESPARFNPVKLDTDQWCRAVKSAGGKGIILTCKHHDGFCLFQTEFTEHSVKNSVWKNGKGDVLAELVKSCEKYALKVGVYLSPWDMNSKLYGTKAYDDYFVNQLTELLTNYGTIFEVWFDGAKGKNAPDFDYDWNRYYALIRKLQPDAVISVCGPDIRWCGNEAGKCRTSEWNIVSAGLADKEKIAKNSQQGANDTAKLQTDTTDDDLGSRELLAQEAELIWYPSEVDVSIRKGWFYHKKQDKTVKSLDKLMSIYDSSVGGNSSLLLNVCPNKEGKMADIDVERLGQMGQAISATFAKPVYEQNEAIPCDENYIDIDFNGSKKVRTVVLREDLMQSQRIEKFDLYLKVGTQYKKVYAGTIIGSKRIIRLPSYAAEACDSVRIHILQSRGTPKLNFIGIYE